LGRRAELVSELPLLRINWYDASHNALPGAEQQRIGELPKVKVRLGRIGDRGQQKGVDLRIGLDMVAHARYGAVDVILLVSGDDDLTEAVEEAQMHGVQVVLLVVPDKNGHLHGVSRHLARAADGIEAMGTEELESVEPFVMVPPPGGLVLDRPPVSGVAAPGGGIPKPGPALIGAAPPGAILRPDPERHGVYRADSVREGPSFGLGENAFGPEEIDAKIQSVVERVVNGVLLSYSEEQRREMWNDKPSVPRDVDGALLRDLAERLDDYDLSDRTRHRLREEFWDKLAQADPSLTATN
jgi:hypothetical protein